VTKIIVDGEGGVGKTTMLKKLESGLFDPQTKLTIGIDFFSYYFNFPNGQKVNAQIWDLVGAERFNFLRPFCYRGASCVVLVVDLSRPNTLEKLEYFIEIAKQANIKNEQIILAGSKADLLYERFVDAAYLKSFVEKYNLNEIIETSARDRNNIEVLFKLATLIAIFSKGTVNEEEFKIYKQDILEQIQDPIREPCVKIVKQCWNCKKPIYYYEFCDTNYSTIPEENLSKLWESQFVQFYCCGCYKKQVKGY